ncbi:zinc metallopeptidase [Ameyamaea chiangmaiensis NBRC 103196]|uniref:Zinc metalloprotease n=1 Tax=Ameyamaea chiangmaiensis TaxID=442969 RepID=A0A850P789_9PROT|nr:RIP metalloprotease RseP [Ameyamaea chiangmaiensis]MBS4074419.1 RIP metalloprotease RseP [Ameyamaea chiangmaiensis]NVN40475.1 RIP metalloprotease RseP [Ameyamaea chiangmaiensis]GBQ71956.1 zinc metallopeptidase [Ameyamaea chiangmaiensis NBRC 103196]
MHELIRTLLATGLVLGVLVFVHELGHYLAARWRGVHVDAFSIGFGRPLLRWHDRVGTEWRVCWIPIGGYVKPHGFEGPEDATPEQKAAWIPGKTFHDKPVGSRAIVILAGPVFNFLLAIILFTGLFYFAGQQAAGRRVAGVVASSAAATAGLRAGDEIEQVGAVSVHSFDDLQPLIARQPGAQTTLLVRRDGHELSLPVTFGQVQSGGHAVGQLGANFAVTVGAPLPFGKAVVAGAAMTWHVTVQTLAGVWQMLTGQHSARDLGGTLRIAQMSGQAAQYGVASLISFMALLSVNLGLINLFPIPILDGGRLVFYALEAILRRPVPRRVQEISFQAGFAVIAGLFLFSTFNDLASFGVFHWLSHKGG